MKEIGLARITTDSIVAFPKGTVVIIDEYEVGDESDSTDCITEDDFNKGQPCFRATVEYGRDNSYSVDVDEDDFELVEPTGDGQ